MHRIHVGQNVQNGSDSEQLRAEPADIDRQHPERRVNPRPLSVFPFDDVGDGQAFEAAQQPHDEDTGDHQAERCAEGIGEHAAEAAVVDGGDDPHARPGAEPGRQQGGGGHPEGKPAAGNQKVIHALDLAARPHSDSDQDGKIENDADPKRVKGSFAQSQRSGGVDGASRGTPDLIFHGSIHLVSKIDPLCFGNKVIKYIFSAPIQSRK